MQLAFRRNASERSNITGRIFNAATRARLVSEYCHGGLVIDGNLYHATFNDGLHCVEAGQWEPEKWELIDIGDARDAQALALFAKHKGAKYDAFSLLCFVGLRIHDDNRFYCFEWMMFVLDPENVTDRATPEKILNYVLTHESRPVEIAL
jgi:hypothetical protein